MTSWMCQKTATTSTTTCICWGQTDTTHWGSRANTSTLNIRATTWAIMASSLIPQATASPWSTSPCQEQMARECQWCRWARDLNLASPSVAFTMRQTCPRKLRPRPQSCGSLCRTPQSTWCHAVPLQRSMRRTSRWVNNVILEILKSAVLSIKENQIIQLIAYINEYTGIYSNLKKNRISWKRSIFFVTHFRKWNPYII